MNLRYPNLRNLILAGVNLASTPINPALMYAIAPGKLILMPPTDSRTYRKARIIESEKIICLYKTGLALTPGEVKSWAYRKSKLTSTRHKNILLRVAHGDIYSNTRLFRFGLINDPKCSNCAIANESITHRLVECPKAVEAWGKLEAAKLKLNLKQLSDLSIDNLLGAKDRLSKVELALNAELLHKLAAIGGSEYCPTQMVKMVVKTMGNFEHLKGDLNLLFKELIRES